MTKGRGADKTSGQKAAQKPWEAGPNQLISQLSLGLLAVLNQHQLIDQAHGSPICVAAP